MEQTMQNEVLNMHFNFIISILRVFWNILQLFDLIELFECIIGFVCVWKLFFHILNLIFGKCLYEILYAFKCNFWCEHNVMIDIAVFFLIRFNTERGWCLHWVCLSEYLVDFWWFLVACFFLTIYRWLDREFYPVNLSYLCANRMK